MNKVVWRGQSAEIRWAYHKAATLGAWTLTVDKDGGRVHADTVSVDAFKVSQQPLTFVVPRPNGVPWRWPVTQVLQNADGVFTASLGPQE